MRRRSRTRLFAVERRGKAPTVTTNCCPAQDRVVVTRCAGRTGAGAGAAVQPGGVANVKASVNKAGVTWRASSIATAGPAARGRMTAAAAQAGRASVGAAPGGLAGAGAAGSSRNGIPPATSSSMTTEKNTQP